MVGLYLALLCLAGTCGVVHAQGAIGAHHSQQQHDQVEQTGGLHTGDLSGCLWACQSAAPATSTGTQGVVPQGLSHAAFIRSPLWGVEPLIPIRLPRGPPR